VRDEMVERLPVDRVGPVRVVRPHRALHGHDRSREHVHHDYPGPRPLQPSRIPVPRVGRSSGGARWSVGEEGHRCRPISCLRPSRSSATYNARAMGEQEAILPASHEVPAFRSRQRWARWCSRRPRPRDRQVRSTRQYDELTTAAAPALWSKAVRRLTEALAPGPIGEPTAAAAGDPVAAPSGSGRFRARTERAADPGEAKVRGRAPPWRVDAWGNRTPDNGDQK